MIDQINITDEDARLLLPNGIVFEKNKKGDISIRDISGFGENDSVLFINNKDAKILERFIKYDPWSLLNE